MMNDLKNKTAVFSCAFLLERVVSTVQCFLPTKDQSNLAPKKIEAW